MYSHADFPNADDRPGEHDPSKGVDSHSRRGSLEEPLPSAAAEAALKPSSSSEAQQPADKQENDRLSNIEEKTSYYADVDDTEDGAEVGIRTAALLVHSTYVTSQHDASTAVLDTLLPHQYLSSGCDKPSTELQATLWLPFTCTVLYNAAWPAACEYR